MATTAPEPTPDSGVPKPMLTSHCPTCGGSLPGNVRHHCDGRPRPCGWIKCKACGSTIDPRRHRAISQ